MKYFLIIVAALTWSNSNAQISDTLTYEKSRKGLFENQPDDLGGGRYVTYKNVVRKWENDSILIFSSSYFPNNTVKIIADKWYLVNKDTSVLFYEKYMFETQGLQINVEDSSEVIYEFRPLFYYFGPMINDYVYVYSCNLLNVGGNVPSYLFFNPKIGIIRAETNLGGSFLVEYKILQKP